MTLYVRKKSAKAISGTRTLRNPHILFFVPCHILDAPQRKKFAVGNEIAV